MTSVLFVLPDGSEVFSGIGAMPAIKSAVFTASVNADTDLDYASACAAMMEAELIDTSGAFSMAAGDELAVYEVDDEGRRTLTGHFILETPARPGANTYQITAYDRMIRFDKDLSVWLTQLQDWPYTMNQFLEMVCDRCGVPLAEGVSLLNGDFEIMKFIRQVTGRQIIKWIAGANAAFARITPGGELTFDTFAEGGSLDLPLKTLKVRDFATAPIARVVVKQTEDDLGVAWPQDAEGETYTILGNPLLAAFSQGDLLPCVERLADRLTGLSYTPAEAQVYTAGASLSPGVFLTVTDRNGRAHKTAVFSVRRRGGVTTVSSTGNPTRAGSSARAGKDQLIVIQGRMVEIKTDLEAVCVSLQETQIAIDGVSNKAAALGMKADGIEAEVRSTQTTLQGVEERITQAEQKATGLEVSVSKKADREEVAAVTEHFIFGDDGLTITNSGTGMGIGISEERVIFTGGSSATTEIRPDKMETTNIRIGSRLDLGQFSFFPRTNGNLSFRFTGGD